MSTRRRDARYQSRFPAQLTFGKRRLSLRTEDISFRGVFLRTDTPPPLRQLVKVRLVVPFAGIALEMHGMTVHVVEHDNADGRCPGIGVSFYGMDRDTRDGWEATVSHVALTAPLANDQAPLSVPENTPEPLRRRFERHTAVLTVSAKSQDELDAFITSDVSKGATFLRTEEAFNIGAAVMVCLHHPDNDATFILDGIVRLEEPGGVGVDFVGLDHTRREELDDFARAGIFIDEEEVRVE